MERGPDHLSPLPVPLVHHLSQHAPHLPHSICRRRPRLCLRALRKAAGLPPPPEIVEKVAKPLFEKDADLPRAGFDRLRRTTLTFAA